MRKVTSKDGTAIAFDRSGTGPAVILVDGALHPHLAVDNGACDSSGSGQTCGCRFWAPPKDKFVSPSGPSYGGDMQDETPSADVNPSQHITNYIAALASWHGQMLARLRTLILEADPDIAEEWKWDTPVWSRKGNVVAIGAFKDYVKLNFFKGAALDDPHGLFNAGLEAKASRAIDLHEGDDINEAALQDLVRAAVAHNLSGGKKK